MARKILWRFVWGEGKKRGSSPTADEERLFLLAVWKQLISGGWCWAPSSLFDVWVPDSDLLLWKPLLVGMQQSVLIYPYTLQMGMCTYIRVPSLFTRRKNKTFKKHPAKQDKISFFFLLFIWQCHSGVCSRLSFPSLFSYSLPLKLSLGLPLQYILYFFFLSFWRESFVFYH